MASSIVRKPDRLSPSTFCPVFSIHLLTGWHNVEDPTPLPPKTRHPEERATTLQSRHPRCRFLTLSLFDRRCAPTKRNNVDGLSRHQREFRPLSLVQTTPSTQLLSHIEDVLGGRLAMTAFVRLNGRSVSGRVTWLGSLFESGDHLDSK
jgi:hypothetical protein